MNLFKKIFPTGNQKNENQQVPWKKLQELNQLIEIEEESKQIPVLIFKHSTRCGISRMALNRFEKNFDIEPGKINVYFLDLLAHRDISNEIAQRFRVFHESPQILLIKDGKAVFHASHSQIDATDLQRFV